MSSVTPSADPTVYIPTNWDRPVVVWKNPSSVVGVYSTDRGLSLTGSLSATLSGERFYTRYLSPTVPDELASKWYVDSMSASLTGKSFTASFVSGNWIASATYYYINFNHNLASTNFAVEVYDTTFPKPTQVFMEDVRNTDENNTEIRISKVPDERFDGVIILGGSGGGGGGSGGGQSGFSGYSGMPGGFSGYSGISGFSGYSGVSGYSGASGTSGASGAGTSGYSGYSGESGASGSGASGSSGFSGYSGISGASGTSGASGVGVSGYSGYSGTSGASGAGTSGYSGYSGESGASGSGASGVSGSSGFSGYSGIGSSGFNSSFVIADWSASSSFYYIIFNHGLGSSNIVFEVYETTTTQKQTFADNALITPNTIELRIPQSPDKRFDGIITINGGGYSGYSGFSGYVGSSGNSGFSGYSGFSGLSSTGGSASVTIGDKSSLLSLTASTITGAMMYSVDTSEFIISDGSNWRSSGPLFGLRANKDMGVFQDSGIIGYGHDYITDKTIYNSAIGGNTNTINGAIRVNTAVTPHTLEIYLRGAWYVIQYDFTYAYNDFRHAPLSQSIKAWKGDSVLVGINGRPTISEYQVSMGNSPVPRVISGGTF